MVVATLVCIAIALGVFAAAGSFGDGVSEKYECMAGTVSGIGTGASSACGEGTAVERVTNGPPPERAGNSGQTRSLRDFFVPGAHGAEPASPPEPASTQHPRTERASLPEPASTPTVPEPPSAPPEPLWNSSSCRYWWCLGRNAAAALGLDEGYGDHGVEDDRAWRMSVEDDRAWRMSQHWLDKRHLVRSGGTYISMDGMEPTYETSDPTWVVDERWEAVDDWMRERPRWHARLIGAWGEYTFYETIPEGNTHLNRPDYERLVFYETLIKAVENGAFDWAPAVDGSGRP